MPADDRNPGTFTPEDIHVLRLLAGALGLVIGATWLVIEDLTARLLMTGLGAGMMLLSLLAIYLLRRFQGRK